MPVRRPLPEELLVAARANHFELAPEELAAYAAIIDGALASYDRLDELVEPKLSAGYPRTTGYRPQPDENPYGAWSWKCSVKGAETGPLAGRRAAVKDVIAVAGMPLQNGSAVMQGFISDIDATVVTRLLDAGCEIAGKATCENFCFSGASNTSFPGPVLNPHDPSRMTGGSSSGSAALLAAGDIELALGCDQGGSIREPSAYCGVYGLKPTFGLVPFTGIASVERTIDHVGPMACTVADVALLLDVIAGRDESDSRTLGAPKLLPSYSEALSGGCNGLRIGIVREGFGWPNASEEDVDDGVRAAALRFRELGAEVRDISIPMHRDGIHVFRGVVLEGAWSTMIRDDGVGRGWTGYYDTHQADFLGRATRTRAHDFSHQVKIVAVLSSYMAERYNSRYYARAQNLRRSLRDAYEQAFTEVDLLAMPSVPQKAIPFDASRSLQDEIALSLNMIQNTCPFDLTGHPAMSVPCGFAQGLPIGLMLVGRRWEDNTVLRAAAGFETLGMGKRRA
jgi:amidase